MDRFANTRRKRRKETSTSIAGCHDEGKCGTAADGITEPRRSRKMMQAKAPPGRAHGFNLSNGSISDIYEAHLDTIQPGSGSRSTVSPSLSASPSLSLAADLMYNLGFLYLPATCPPRPSDGSPCYFSLSGQALDFHSRTKAMKFLPYVDFPRSVLALRIPIRGGLAALARDIIKIARDSRCTREFSELNFPDKRPEIVYIFLSRSE